MITKYGLKILEYLLYGLALLFAVPLAKPDLISILTPTDFAAALFLLLGIGVLVPRVIAYLSWPKVVARVGPYRGTWDGEKSARYTYRIGNQTYSHAVRAMWGSEEMTRLQVCVNPHAPWVKYPVFWNVWLFGATMVAFGVFLLVSGIQFLGW
ncbi:MULTISPECIES: hypothetical protein [unclassified Yoonia]|uniref:hypothetical protein n=1 Tax=unclassified Yoonia TaxID=2629118 RepID=UPI002AFF82B5|nr:MULTISPECIES: hypothetical protein [unclassified Yoonia]